MSPGPIRIGHQATVTSADGPGSRLDRGQRCSAATSLATASTGTVLLPSKVSQIAGHGGEARYGGGGGVGTKRKPEFDWAYTGPAECA